MIAKTTSASLAVLLLSGALLAGCNGSDDAATPAPAPEATPREHASRSFTVDEAGLPFTALAGATAYYGTYAGIHGPAGYRIEVPDNWNGVLVMYAHGYRGTGETLTVSNPNLRQHLIDNGYAWAASSYSANYYDVRAGVEDTNALALGFAELTGLPAPSKYYITGHSMGGHITGAAIEAEAAATAASKVSYAGAVPMCGVMGDIELYNYFVAYNYAAHQLAGIPAQSFPIQDHDALLPDIKAALWTDYSTNKGAMTAQGEKLKGILMNLSGGPRPIFETSFPLFQDLLLGYGSRDGTWVGMTTENIVNTSGIEFQFDANPALSTAEQSFNTSIYRVQGDMLSANPLQPDSIRWIPLVQGEFSIPVVSIHTLGDLFVPFKMQQIYAQRAAANGNADWLVQRAIRGDGHCGFEEAEEVAAFDAMVTWETQGVKPAGDDVLTPAVVADPNYGCTFTTADRAGLPACP